VVQAQERHRDIEGVIGGGSDSAQASMHGAASPNCGGAYPLNASKV
jgi:hypothetical protein